MGIEEEFLMGSRSGVGRAGRSGTRAWAARTKRGKERLERRYGWARGESVKVGRLFFFLRCRFFFFLCHIFDFGAKGSRAWDGMSVKR